VELTTEKNRAEKPMVGFLSFGECARIRKMKVKGEYGKTEGFCRRQDYGEQDGGRVSCRRRVGARGLQEMVRNRQSCGLGPLTGRFFKHPPNMSNQQDMVMMSRPVAPERMNYEL
jgi:hypothetical protein